jgi:hypothetical protein
MLVTSFFHFTLEILHSVTRMKYLLMKYLRFLHKRAMHKNYQCQNRKTRNHGGKKYYASLITTTRIAKISNCRGTIIWDLWSCNVRDGVISIAWGANQMVNCYVLTSEQCPSLALGIMMMVIMMRVSLGALRTPREEHGVWNVQVHLGFWEKFELRHCWFGCFSR